MTAGNIRGVLSKMKEDELPGETRLKKILEWVGICIVIILHVILKFDYQLTEICLGLEYLHNEKVVHGDLRGVSIAVNFLVYCKSTNSCFIAKYSH